MIFDTVIVKCIPIRIIRLDEIRIDAKVKIIIESIFLNRSQ